MLFSMNFNTHTDFIRQRNRAQSMAAVGNRQERYSRRPRLVAAMDQVIEEKEIEPPDREAFERYFAPLDNK